MTLYTKPLADPPSHHSPCSFRMLLYLRASQLQMPCRLMSQPCWRLLTRTHGSRNQKGPLPSVHTTWLSNTLTRSIQTIQRVVRKFLRTPPCLRVRTSVLNAWGPFPEVKAAGAKLTTHPHPRPRLGMMHLSYICDVCAAMLPILHAPSCVSHDCTQRAVHNIADRVPDQWYGKCSTHTCITHLGMSHNPGAQLTHT